MNASKQATISALSLIFSLERLFHTESHRAIARNWLYQPINMLKYVEKPKRVWYSTAIEDCNMYPVPFVRFLIYIMLFNHYLLLDNHMTMPWLNRFSPHLGRRHYTEETASTQQSCYQHERNMYDSTTANDHTQLRVTKHQCNLRDYIYRDDRGNN